MALTPGARLGQYEISEVLGVGGMGEVYRARDSKLSRTVAVKVLLPAVANDPDRLVRFEREARALAALNHQNVAQIYGLDDAQGTAFLVMELVEGPTLAERIAKGPLPLDEALELATQIAKAVEAAHEQGIIHRDLKPANVKVRVDGVVKVLDFGLAKVVEPVHGHAVAESPTVTSPATMTHAGVILGTAAYMSPEQARGQAIDSRNVTEPVARLHSDGEPSTRRASGTADGSRIVFERGAGGSREIWVKEATTGPSGPSWSFVEYQIPSSKLQAPTHSQNQRLQNLRCHWASGDWECLGIWSLELGN